MNKENFTSYMYGEFPSVFETSFAREMLENILGYAESLSDESERCNFLSSMIPQITEKEIRNFLLNNTAF